MAKEKQTPERKVLVTIRSQAGKKPAKLEAWRYWEIVGELTWRGVDRIIANETAHWCFRTAKPGERRELPDYGVTVEVTAE